MIWPFRRRKPKAQRPPLNEDWRPGDRACCIDGDWGLVKGPAKGSIHCVEFVYPGQCNTSGLPGWGLKLAGYDIGFDATAFRKVVPDQQAACSSEFAANIKRLAGWRAPKPVEALS